MNKIIISLIFVLIWIFGMSAIPADADNAWFAFAGVNWAIACINTLDYFNE